MKFIVSSLFLFSCSLFTKKKNLYFSFHNFYKKNFNQELNMRKMIISKTEEGFVSPIPVISSKSVDDIVPFIAEVNSYGIDISFNGDAIFKLNKIANSRLLLFVNGFFYKIVLCENISPTVLRVHLNLNKKDNQEFIDIALNTVKKLDSE